jgi:glycogen(starch) synthase
VRLLIHTRFHPNVGGIETAASILAHEWITAGVSVTVITDVGCDPSKKGKFPFPVHHRPSAEDCLRLLRKHDVFVHFNVSLRALWPLLFVRRPFVVSHQGFYVVNLVEDRDWREKLKLIIARRASANIAASEAIRQRIGGAGIVIPNPFDAEIFREKPNHGRSRDLVFVGRLVSDKGADLLLQALRHLGGRGIKSHLTIIGDGPERLKLERLAHQLDLHLQVRFIGAKSQREVAEELRIHKVLVVPSVWNEPFGVVALEGIASGCLVVGSSGGGLPEAIGPCGVTFPNGDAVALAGKIEELLTNDQLVVELLSHADEHLAKHHPTRVAEQYLEVIRDAACLK